ncbi:MAG TPA: lysophospholipid acyltransferase family protein [Methylomirabilota bacterium]|jgi:1-acyl-sn-glycerol-3-phosphate acyltransferase|nr:lysophospholipid acyltransferase family protein [Methylomirabilota bacterium]
MAEYRGADRPDRFYAVVRSIGRFWVWFFFKSVDVRRAEQVPRRGPVLLCINHPNNLIDSLLVGAVLSRKVHYLATATLFRNALLARFLTACGAIPVYRKQDRPDRMDRNVDTFAACFGALERGELIGIYPEGTTHAEARVQRIKTGAARIALEYESRRGAGSGDPLSLVPVGLTFDARKSFRGRVRVAFGEPVAVTPYLAAYREDPVKAVDALTTAIQWAMEAQVLHVERADRAELIRAVEELYRSDLVRELHQERGLSASQIDPLRLSQTIADAVAYFEAHEPERVERLWRELRHYRAMLAAYRVRDQAVRARLDRSTPARRLLHSWEASLGFPVFLYGVVVNALPYLVPRWLARRTARKETDYATTRLLSSVVAFPLFWGLEIWLVGRLAGAGWATLFAASLPLSGLLAYRYLGGAARLGSQLRFGVLSVTRHQAASRLLAARRTIIGLLEEAKTDYLTATRGSTF